MNELLERHHLVAERLGHSGARYTTSRRAVVAALSDVSGPVSPADLHERMEGVPLSSLYRSLGVLETAGVVTRSHDPNGVGLVELDEWLTGHHHHVVCISCGEVRDIDLDRVVEGRLDAIADEIATATGYQMMSHRMDIEGVCASCR